jgi:outer membrane protein assembly factor BamA
VAGAWLLSSLLMLTAGGPAPAQTPRPAAPPPQGVVAEILVHGNYVTSDEDVIRLAGLEVGAAVGPDTIAGVAARLRATGRFEHVQVLERFASIADPSRIVVVIIVDEGPVRIAVPDDPDAPLRVVKRRGLRNLMFMPILTFEDGYGATYGARLALADVGGERGRLSFPLTWGGLDRAGAEYDRTFTTGALSRVQAGAALQRQTNPAFREDDSRKRLWGRAERAIRAFRFGADAAWQRVSFAGTHDTVRSIGADAAFDTRLDPVLPRNAVYATASWERLSFASGGPATDRTRLEARGYVGLVGQTALVLRVVREDASRPLPPYLESLLGGWSTLRGFKAGAFVGDTLVLGSVELRVPLTSALSVGKLGVSLFVDTGTAYDKGQHLRDQILQTGIGGSVWVTVAAFHMGVSVAHGRGAGTRVNFGGGVSF